MASSTSKRTTTKTVPAPGSAPLEHSPAGSDAYTRSPEPESAPPAPVVARTARGLSRPRLRTATSDLLSRYQFASTVEGLTFDGLRDWYVALGYKVRLTLRDYRMRFERGGIAERIVEALPVSTWSGGAEVIEDPSPEVVTTFEEAVATLFERLDFWGRMTRADILAGLGRYSIILIGAPGKFDSPLPRTLSPDSVLYLRAISEESAPISSFVQDPSSPRYGLPEFYNVTISSSLTSKVHWSRVIHVADGCLENDVYGKPRLSAVWNYLDDLTKLVGGGAEAAWRRMDPGLHVDIDPETEIDTEEQDAIEEQLEDYEHNLRRTLQTRGTKITPLSAAVARFSENVMTIMRLISGVTGIPQRILMGSERGELASIQDRNNWNDKITQRRGRYAIPLVRQFLATLIDKGALPAPASKSGYVVRWPEIEELSEDEKGTLTERLTRANRAQFQAKAGVILSASEIRDRVWGLGRMSEEERKEIEEILEREARMKAEAAAAAAAKLTDKNEDGGDGGEDEDMTEEAVTPSDRRLTAATAPVPAPVRVLRKGVSRA